MSDEFDIIHLNQDETQEIIDWAVSAAAMVVLMDSAPVHDNVADNLEKLEGYIQAVNILLNNLPDVLRHPAAVIANESIEEALEEEAIVDEFKEELKDL